MQRLMRDALWIGAVGFAFSLAMNEVSPRGLSLTRDYFPKPVGAPGKRNTASDAGNVPASVAPTDPANALARQVQDAGFRLIAHSDVVALLQDPRFQQGLVALIDARDRAHFSAGHIPGAYSFDHYRMEDHIAEVAPACQIAEQVVVYCSGGKCEDSLFAARDLVDLGVDPAVVWIYGGGITQWKEAGEALEKGGRLSGVLTSGRE